jgi:hypothetical protein
MRRKKGSSLSASSGVRQRKSPESMFKSGTVTTVTRGEKAIAKKAKKASGKQKKIVKKIEAFTDPYMICDDVYYVCHEYCDDLEDTKDCHEHCDEMSYYCYDREDGMEDDMEGDMGYGDMGYGDMGMMDDPDWNEPPSMGDQGMMDDPDWNEPPSNEDDFQRRPGKVIWSDEGFDLPGVPDDGSNGSLEECKKMCRENSACVAFTFDTTTDNNCWLKGAKNNTEDSLGEDYVSDAYGYDLYMKKGAILDSQAV